MRKIKYLLCVISIILFFYLPVSAEEPTFQVYCVNEYSQTEKEIVVQNGKIWGEHLEKKTDICTIGGIWRFNGWYTNSGEYIDLNAAINLTEDTTIHAEYEWEEVKPITISFPEFNHSFKIKYMESFSDKEIPVPTREHDTFIGWSTSKVDFMNNMMDFTNEVNYYFSDQQYYAIWQSDVDRLNGNIYSKEKLSNNRLYYMSTGTTGCIWDPVSKRDVALNYSSFSKSDIKHAAWLISKVLNSNKNVLIVPKDLSVSTKIKNKYRVVSTDWDVYDLEKAISYMNVRYFQYLPMIKETTGKDKRVDGKSVVTLTSTPEIALSVEDFEDREVEYLNLDQPAYLIQIKTFKRYYQLSAAMEQNIAKIAKKLSSDMTVAEAVYKLNEFCYENYSYDYSKCNNSLYWFFFSKEHSGTCISYAELAFSVLAYKGVEAYPYECTVPEGETGHIYNRVSINNKPYYIDFCWNCSIDSFPYLFMDEEVMNTLEYHKKSYPQLDYGTAIRLTSTQNHSPKIISLKRTGNLLYLHLSKNKDISGYKIQICSNRTFNKSKTIRSSKNKIKIRLKKSKTYYFRICSFWKEQREDYSNGKQFTKIYYSSWGKTRKQ